jgi:TPR repeat protein
MKGWVYVITNEGFKDIVKIGFSGQDPERRAKELSKEGSPYPYVVEYWIHIDNPYSLEQATHKLLDLKREVENKEWFRCTVDEAIAAIKEVVTQQSIKIRDEETKLKIKNISKHETTKKLKRSHENLSNNHLDIFQHNESIPIERSKDFLERLALAEQGNINAQYLLGLMYQLGQGINKDYSEAIEWYRKAAENNHIDAQVKLGHMFYTVSWRHKNSNEAIIWFSKAAKQGNVEAQFYLANMYQHGQGVTCDLKEAENWYVKVIENGDDEMKRKVINACLSKNIQYAT